MWKIVVPGGLAYYATFFLLSLLGGGFIHGPEGVLDALYRDHAAFWRPELNVVPPDTGALMKLWVPVGLFSAFLVAGIYAVVRPAFSGPGWLRGVKFGVVGWLFGLVAALGYWGIFNLPGKFWAWWLAEGAWMHLLAGAALGWVAEKLAPAPPGG